MRVEKLSEKLPHGTNLEEWDKTLLVDLHKVFERHGLKGTIKHVEFDCGTPPPKPEIELRCFRYCVPGPDDKPICTWICW